MTIVVTGANGTVGSHLVAQLADAGHPTRALVRDAAKGQALEREGVEIAVGGYEDAASLDAAIDGAEAVFLLSPTTPQLFANEQAVIEAALRRGEPRVVKLSGINASMDSPVEFLRLHAQSVDRLRGSGLPHTVLEPNDFMQNLLRQAQEVHEGGKITSAMGNASVSHIDVRDVAEVALLALTTDGHEGATHKLTGPEALSRAEVAERMSRMLGREIHHEDVPWPKMRERLLALGLPDWAVDWQGELAEHYRAGRSAEVVGTFEDLTGHPPHSMDQFLDYHRQAFLTGVGGRWP